MMHCTSPLQEATNADASFPHSDSVTSSTFPRCSRRKRTAAASWGPVNASCIGPAHGHVPTAKLLVVSPGQP